MSRQIRQYLPVLKQIVLMRDSARRTYLKNCDRRLLDCVSECAKNVLNKFDRVQTVTTSGGGRRKKLVVPFG